MRSQLYGLHGWEALEEVRAPQGTAFTRWAVLPRLATADMAGNVVLVALASLTAEPAAGPLAPVVDKVHVRPGPDGGIRAAEAEVEVGWAEDGTRTRIAFGQGAVAVEHSQVGP